MVRTWCLVVLSVGLTSSSLEAGDGFPSVLVSTEWLNEHLSDPSLVVLNIVFNRYEYEVGHIPGARQVLWSSIVAPPPQPNSGGLSTELPPIEQLDSVLESTGVTNGSRVVIAGALMPSARLFVTLEYLGLKGNVAILEGGTDAWREERRPLTSDYPVFKQSVFTPDVQKHMIVTAEWVRDAADRPRITLVDARTPQYYIGLDSAGGPRSGHVPGACNLPYNTVTRELGKYRDMSDLATLAEEAGVQKGDTVVTYCHVGQTASIVYVALRQLGYDAAMYDGSFQEWSRRTEFPVELTPRE
jgi:thiosulfate/3-mercaptopyruvate sulfurtransferase